MIMTCPKCKGSGKGWIDYGRNSSATPHEAICNSCGGMGYVVDTIQLCSKCGKVMPVDRICIEWQIKE